MKHINLFLIIVLLHFFTVGCDKSSITTSADSSNESNQDSDFYSYLELKNIPIDNKKRVEIAKQRFEQRNKLVSSILKQPLLDRTNIDVEIAEYKKQIVMTRYFEKFLKEKVNEEAIRNYFVSNATKYQAKKIHIAHILIRTNPKMSKEEREALLTKAHEVYSRATSNEEFSTLVKAYSDDKLSAKKEGDLGWIKEGAIDKAFSNKVFEMKQGDISEPISTPYGYHIVKVLDAAKVVKQPFDVVKGNIRYELRQLAKQAETERLLKLSGIERKK